jgi:uncharacterized protein YidB (DUF937 family)
MLSVLISQPECAMGLLDSIVGAVAGGNGGSTQLVGALLQMLAGQQGGAAASPLEGLVRQFTQGGLGEAVQSWIGTGQNIGISPQQLEQVLGGGQLAQLAQQFGIEPGQVAAQLSEQLPGMVDRLTPEGQLPAGGMQDLLGQLSGLLNR